MNPKPLTKDKIGWKDEEGDGLDYWGPEFAIHVDDVRSALAGLIIQLAGNSALQAIDGNTQSERAYTHALRLVDVWFPAFADEKEEKK